MDGMSGMSWEDAEVLEIMVSHVLEVTETDYACRRGMKQWLTEHPPSRLDEGFSGYDIFNPN